MATRPVVFSSVFTVGTLIWCVGLGFLSAGVFGWQPTEMFDMRWFGVMILGYGAAVSMVLPKVADIGSHNKTRGIV